MSIYENVPMTAYEITWASGHVETIWAHQVSWPNAMQTGMREMFATTTTETRAFEPKVQFMGEVDGRWVLILSAWESDIRTIRNRVTEDHIGGAA
ncbi:hypothetical protein AB0I28_12280 [Phytomonospora sp. NPDC050363]|uniref:hypothetical protein n=1 Tax=Phytomonospora sp. NPDC050363 TaxID=3155642 RepID=UPI0034003260